jgi:hypothetical protein
VAVTDIEVLLEAEVVVAEIRAVVVAGMVTSAATISVTVSRRIGTIAEAVVAGTFLTEPVVAGPVVTVAVVFRPGGGLSTNVGVVLRMGGGRKTSVGVEVTVAGKE